MNRGLLKSLAALCVLVAVPACGGSSESTDNAIVLPDRVPPDADLAFIEKTLLFTSILENPLIVAGDLTVPPTGQATLAGAGILFDVTTPNQPNIQADAPRVFVTDAELTVNFGTRVVEFTQDNFLDVSGASIPGMVTMVNGQLDVPGQGAFNGPLSGVVEGTQLSNFTTANPNNPDFPLGIVYGDPTNAAAVVLYTATGVGGIHDGILFNGSFAVETP